MAALAVFAAGDSKAQADGVEWQIREGEKIVIAFLDSPHIYRICLYAEMFDTKTTFEPKVRTLKGSHDLQLPHPPIKSRCIDIEAKRIEIFGGEKVTDPNRIAFGTYDLVQ